MAYRGDPEKHRAYQRTNGRAFYLAAREQRLAYQRAYREAHREEIREGARAYRAHDTARNANRAAERAGTPGRITAADVRAVWEVGHCVYCGGDGLGLDHVTPLSRGGANDPTNLVRCCRPCNSSKKDRTPEEWRPDPA